ncbi:TNF receptor-associated factor 4-like [Oopsacas minuta]|uniref:TNF receptor-associated factor 4-like n=1 Tax=Oopsacas minuta TaxID=111878 RepID=A0AAV7JCK9_9METZ|nr:TNF receptor-associated factor 4-like [Oopsacas minuta]
MAENLEDLVYVKTQEGDYRGWRVDLLVENLSGKVEEELLRCNICDGLLREACLFQGELRCRVCIPNEGVIWQPAKQNRVIVNDKKISCPLKKRGCEWSNTVSTALQHLKDCEFFPVLCPLRCVSLEGDMKGKVLKLERRLIPQHQRDSCPFRQLVCEFCLEKVKACEMNSHLRNCKHFPIPCPNECVTEGKEGTKQVKRKDVPVHLTDECPLQKLQCPYWNHGCTKKIEER